MLGLGGVGALAAVIASGHISAQAVLSGLLSAIIAQSAIFLWKRSTSAPLEAMLKASLAPRGARRLQRFPCLRRVMVFYEEISGDALEYLNTSGPKLYGELVLLVLKVKFVTLAYGCVLLVNYILDLFKRS
jgi:hypothetical protein